MSTPKPEPNSDLAIRVGMPEAQTGKIFPRNLTAHADYVVRGNPVISRPEDSVGNTIPGLEYDERNLDKYFFQGLVFEFQRGVSGSDLTRPLLRVVTGDGPAAVAGLVAADVDYANLPEDQLVLLWAVRSANGRRFEFFSERFSDGGVQLGCWRAIRDLEQGLVTVMLATVATRRDQALFGTALTEWENNGSNRVVRADGTFQWAVLSGETLPILVDGVINLAIPVGELQSTMCTPWQYDFRDCKCYYWAANRPDVVASDRRDEPFEKFLRRDRTAPAVHSTDHKEWLSLNGLNHVEVLDGWEELPVTLNDREVSYIHEDVRQTFRRLATVEHALLLEYLYAYYTLDQTKGASVVAAAKDLLKVAIEEMHHFRWVNEILNILGEPPEVGRAADYGANFNFRPFDLAPFTQEKLEWFIQVEKPSQSLNMPGQIDGMYVRLYLIIGQNQAAFPQSADLLRLIKLIIDEGETHYQAFMAVKRNLAAFGNFAEVLRRENTAPLTNAERTRIDMSNAAYSSLLSQLQATFSLGDNADGRVIQMSVRSMHQMDSLNQLLAAQGRFPRFTLPESQYLPGDLIGPLDRAERDLRGVAKRVVEEAENEWNSSSALRCAEAHLSAIWCVREAVQSRLEGH